MSNKKGILQPDLIHILDFKITKGSVVSPDNLDESKIANFGFDVILNIGFNIEDNQVKADLEVIVVAVDENEEPLEAAGEFNFSFYFVVDNLKDLVTEGKDGNTVNGGLGNAIASITYSTSRGIIMTRFQGTAMKGFMLPVIDPNSLLNKEAADKK